MSLATRKPQLKQLQVTQLLKHSGTLLQAEIRSGDNLYHVAMPEKVFSHLGHYEYRATCHCKAAGFDSCLGNCRHTVCKHSIATFKTRLRNKGILVSIVEDVQNGKRLSQAEQQANAEKLAHLGGVVVSLKSTQGNGRIWAVARRMH